MPKIKCDVKNCTYNYETKCTRRNIDVESMQALIKDETYCESFVPKSTMTMNYEFASFDGKTKPSVDVYCNVVNCVYEKNQKCYADRVEILADNNDLNKRSTHCQTFEPID